jgi:hypothetical protein
VRDQGGRLISYTLAKSLGLFNKAEMDR